ncbi:MAG: aminotransferase class I/II-fold pyridoxal phosphate-dependent enzyme, partial [Cyclobacteriaceae bacterium]|nr:aminotransferase class I/II-fold pyridoxal phosphate-dependent enzyme [Cyclobacteriaceae bacterium]
MEVYGAEERKEVMDVLETGALFRYGHEHIRKGMWKVAEFEAEVCKHTGAKYAHAVSSGTAAVTSIMAAAGIGHGDEVIVPPYTFVAPIEAVFLAGALPVFAEIDDTICLSPEGIEAAVTPNTKAVLLIHMCGAAADLDGILAVCKKHNLVLLEDCGQAMGASYKGKSVGLHGAAGAFSFDYFKITTCGEGGMTITNDQAIYKNIDQVADHGHTHEGDNRGMEDHHIMGANF